MSKSHKSAKVFSFITLGLLVVSIGLLLFMVIAFPYLGDSLTAYARFSKLILYSFLGKPQYALPSDPLALVSFGIGAGLCFVGLVWLILTLVNKKPMGIVYFVCTCLFGFVGSYATFLFSKVCYINEETPTFTWNYYHDAANSTEAGRSQDALIMIIFAAFVALTIISALIMLVLTVVDGFKSNKKVEKKTDKKETKTAKEVAPKAVEKKAEPKKEEAKPEAKEEPKAEEVKPEPAKEEPKAEETKPELVKEEPKAEEPVKEESKAEVAPVEAKEEPKVEEKNPEPKKEAPKAEKKPEPKKEASKAAPAKKAEEKKPEPKKEAPKTAPTKKEEPKAEPKKEAPKAAAPAKKAEPAKEAPKADETDEEKKKGPKVYHVSQHPTSDKWQVKLAGGEKALKLFDTQLEAIKYAKQMANNQEGSIRVHSMSGKIRKA